MKKYIIIPVLVLTLTGCAQLNSARDWLAAPATQQAATTLRSGAIAFACGVASSSAIAGKIETAIKAQKAAIDITGNVFTVSSMVCQSFGGTVTGTVIMQ